MTHKCCRCSNRAIHQLIEKFGKYLLVEEVLFMIDDNSVLMNSVFFRHIFTWISKLC
jgi:hypothetical protein